MHDLYQLSFLLAGDDRTAERCFVGAMEDCAKEKRVFREWAPSCAKRVIVYHAIRELHSRRGHPNSPAFLSTIFVLRKQLSGPIEHFVLDAVLELADFERFAFVLCVLERYREHECALLLGCSALEALTSETNAFSAEVTLVQARHNELLALVQLYEALGGEWQQ